MDNFFSILKECALCPRKCNVNRIAGEKGVCRASASVKVSLASLHKWEEPCISGDNGSGTVFFTSCNLKCVFCQNYEISQKDYGKEVTIEHLAEIFLNLQGQGANNINLVSPTHFMPQIKEALKIAKLNGLNIPVVYNSNGYETVDALRFMEGMVDIYLPDLKYYNDEYGTKYSSAPHYFQYATKAILEMYRQVGSPEFDDNGLIKNGLI
ncbi:MAG TPA: radical SAM protein, partial [Clostridiales bacterium]|nr:radical SAM protein [Clostridiales bacterium]